MSFTTAWKGDGPLVRIEMERNKTWEQWILLWADRHWDNVGTDQNFMLEELELARDRNAIIWDVGDFFCAMQGKYDPRSSKGALRPEHLKGDYLDCLVETATDFLGPYADLFAVMSQGNHEGSIKNRYETDLTGRLVNNLRRLGSKVVQHKYNGFTRLQFHDNRYTRALVGWHTHGYGGGGPVTKDVIQTNRQGVFLEGVDFVISGHTHDAWVVPQAVVRFNRQNIVEHRERLHIKIPSMKTKFGKNSWEDERGMPPKPIGSYWMRISYNHKADDVTFDVHRSKP